MNNKNLHLKNSIVDIGFVRNITISLAFIFCIFGLIYFFLGDIPAAYINSYSATLAAFFYVVLKKINVPQWIAHNLQSLLVFLTTIGVYYINTEVYHTQLYWLAGILLLAAVMNDIKNVVFWLVIIFVFVLVSYVQSLYQMRVFGSKILVSDDLLFDVLGFYAAIFFCVYFNDKIQQRIIDNLEKANQSLEKAQSELLSSQKYKDDFFAKISHEIRTPLIGIKGIADLLQQNPTEEDTGKYYDSLRYSADHLLDIVNDILDISRINEQQLQLDPSTFDIRLLVSETFQALKVLADDKKLDYRMQFSDDFPQFIHADKKRLAQILYNLVQNAIKFTKKGFVHLYGSIEKNQIQIEVTDSGIGISEAFMNRLYEGFAQEGRIVPGTYQGTGLGLSISAKLIQLMGGTITCYSKLDEGTQFTFLIPYTVPEVELTPAKTEEVAPQNTSELPIRFLLADDHDMNLLIAERILANEFPAAQFALAKDGTEVLELLKKATYDVLLLDLQMPNMDGYETATAIRAMGSQLPIFAVTASINDQIIEQCYRIGMNEVIVKPFSGASMRALVCRYYSGKK